MFKKIIPFLSLFTSLSTIFCCALPIILVTLGMGAVFASLTQHFPAIIWAAEHAKEIFILATTLLLISGYLIFIKPQSCPTEKKLAQACIKTKKINQWIWSISVIILTISLFFKYILILIY